MKISKIVCRNIFYNRFDYCMYFKEAKKKYSIYLEIYKRKIVWIYNNFLSKLTAIARKMYPICSNLIIIWVRYKQKKNQFNIIGFKQKV